MFEINPKGFSVYSDLLNGSLEKKSSMPSFVYSFNGCTRVDVTASGFKNLSFVANFFEEDNHIYSCTLGSGMFGNILKAWVSDWRIEMKDSDGKIIDTHSFLEDLKKSKILIRFDSSSLGDTIAWMGCVKPFMEKYSPGFVYVSTFYNDLFKSEYPEIEFIEPNTNYRDAKIIIGLGWYTESDRNVHKRDPRTIPLQSVAEDILGLSLDKEQRPRISKTFNPPPVEGRYVCIATESTAGAKYWHHPGGWQKLVDLLNTLGYSVVVIQKQSTTLKNVIDRTGDLPLNERISDLLGCDFFIGIGSGLSWLAWGLDIPVVMISGFSQPFCEFSDKTLRIINTKVCHGCFNNPDHKFDKGDWWWCPEHKNTSRHFECTKSITPQEVLRQILNSNIAEWKHSAS